MRSSLRQARSSFLQAHLQAQLRFLRCFQQVVAVTEGEIVAVEPRLLVAGEETEETTEFLLILFPILELQEQQ
jgi:hypothetical protein